MSTNLLQKASPTMTAPEQLALLGKKQERNRVMVKVGLGLSSQAPFTVPFDKIRPLCGRTGREGTAIRKERPEPTLATSGAWGSFGNR